VSEKCHQSLTFHRNYVINSIKKKEENKSDERFNTENPVSDEMADHVRTRQICYSGPEKREFVVNADKN